MDLYEKRILASLFCQNDEYFFILVVFMATFGLFVSNDDQRLENFTAFAFATILIICVILFTVTISIKNFF